LGIVFVSTCVIARVRVRECLLQLPRPSSAEFSKLPNALAVQFGRETEEAEHFHRVRALSFLHFGLRSPFSGA
jgi:hypothetical protein